MTDEPGFAASDSAISEKPLVLLRTWRLEKVGVQNVARQGLSSAT
jgi:hypothetical protein